MSIRISVMRYDYSRWVDNLHVAVLMLSVQLLRRRVDSWFIVTQLQESLHSSRRVLWSLTIVTVRQVEHQTRSLQPFPLSGSDELIDDTLSIVGKVTELRLPDSQAVGRDQRVTQFETKGTEFGQVGVGDCE